MSEWKNNEAKLVEVTLVGDHTHAGVKSKAGDKIKVSEPERDWLIANNKVAAPAAKEPK